MRLAGPLAFLAVFGGAAASACSSDTPNLLERPFDAGVDAGSTLDAPGPGAAEASDPDLGGPCVDDAECQDGIACEYDACDKTLGRCRYTPDDSLCDDGIYCDGREVCVLHHGCEPGPVVTCDTGDSCTINKCVESTKSCSHTPRDLDGDGDPDAHCDPGHDCNDLDPTVASTHAEVCANHKDDNCNGLVDEHPCVDVGGQSCGDAVAIPGAGYYSISTVGANKVFTATCSVTTPTGGKDVMTAITIPPGPNQDLEVWATTPSAEVSVAIFATCGDASSELACASGTGATSLRARARDLAAGTYYALVTTEGESSVELEVNLLTPTPKATNQDCSSAAPLAIGTPTTVSLVDPDAVLTSACDVAGDTGALTYSITLSQASDVKVFGSTLLGSGSPILGLRDPACTQPSDELRCAEGSALPLFARNLAPATYVLTVASTSPADLNILVETYPPTTAPADESCASPPSILYDVTTNVDLSQNENVVDDGCLPGGVNAVFDLPLATSSDVLLVGRFPDNDTGAVAFDSPGCQEASQVACGSGTTPVRVDKRNIPPGDYRAVISDKLALGTSLTPLVRASVPPTGVSGADLCANDVEIPATGGFFEGDTTNATGNYDSPCDAPGLPAGGAPDQVLHLALTQNQRVVFDMDGSTYTTLLDVRTGGACPGTPVPGACYVGFTGPRSFLDLELTPGDYWVIVKGYDMDRGPFDLDVRVVAP